MRVQTMRLFEGTPFDRPPRCDRCGLLEKECKCEPEPAPATPPEKQTARIAVEKRKNKRVVTVVRGLDPDGDLQAVLTQLKSACGAGGTIKDDVLEVQGNHLERIRASLQEMRFRVRG